VATRPNSVRTSDGSAGGGRGRGTGGRKETGFYIVNSGLSMLQNGHQDLYEPGTQRGSAYMRGLSSIYQTDSMMDSATAIAGLILKGMIQLK
jgi:hypothetical protein